MINYDGRKLLSTIIMTEENVAALYKDLSEKVNDTSAKKVFLNLSEDEEKHKNMYTNILSKLPNGGKVDLTEDEVEYTELLINTNIFTNGKVKSRYLKSDALVMAEKIERDSILFYTQLKRLFPDVAKDEMEIILKEEKKHLKKVTDFQLDMITHSLGL
jgi:rubrerythrin